MRLFTIIMLLLLGCSPTVVGKDDEALTPGPSVQQTCRREPGSDEQTAATAVEMLLLASARARADDVQCGTPAPAVVVCRALLVVATLDPARHTDDPVQLARVADTMDWVLRGAIRSSTDSDLTSALADLARLNREIATAETDAERLPLVVERAQPDIANTLDQAWRACPT